MDDYVPCALLLQTLWKGPKQGKVKLERQLVNDKWQLKKANSKHCLPPPRYQTIDSGFHVISNISRYL